MTVEDQPSPQPPSTAGATLIEFNTDSDENERSPSSTLHRPPPRTAVISPPAPQKSVFGNFDPWGVNTSTARTMNLLDLEDNLSPPSDSEQSEVRTVGTEAFKRKSTSLRTSPVPLPANQFDPFGSESSRSGSGGGVGDMFGNPNAFGHSSSTENLPTHNSSQQQSNIFGSNFLNPSVGAANLPHRHSSAPNVAALGNPSFAPTLSDIPQSPNVGSHAGPQPAQQMHSIMTPNYQFSAFGGRTSPHSGHLMTGTTSPLGFHAHSTGHLQQQLPVGKGRGAGSGGKGGNRVDPFADLGNVKMGASSAGSNPTKQSKPQTAPQGSPAMTNRSTYQYYKQQPSRGPQQPPATTQPSRQQAAYQPNYSSSVLGDRSERGPRLKTGWLCMETVHTCTCTVYVYDPVEELYSVSPGGGVKRGKLITMHRSKHPETTSKEIGH